MRYLFSKIPKWLWEFAPAVPRVSCDKCCCSIFHYLYQLVCVRYQDFLDIGCCYQWSYWAKCSYWLRWSHPFEYFMGTYIWRQTCYLCRSVMPIYLSAFLLYHLILSSVFWWEHKYSNNWLLFLSEQVQPRRLVQFVTFNQLWICVASTVDFIFIFFLW